jgi:hypothetical protein
MTAETVVAAQIIRLLRHHPPGVWELLGADVAPRAGDVILREADGTPAAYARPEGSTDSNK